jgi:hypothetical protein
VGWLFLAMAHQRLGEPGQASRWYNRAVRWMEHNPRQSAPFRHVREEAARLLEP